MKIQKKILHTLIASTVVLSSIIGICGYKYYKKYVQRPYLTVIGYVNMTEGLGRQSAELINTFKDEFSIGFISTRHNHFQDTPKALEKIVNTKLYKLGKVVLFEDTLWAAGMDLYKVLIDKLKKDGPQKSNDQVRIAYSMYESSKIPHTWTKILNNYFDAVVVPDKFLIDVYKNSGVKIPIFEIPLGLELENFIQEPLKHKSHTPFVFGNLTAHSDRKNQIALIQAFAKEFGNNPGVVLKINSRYGEPEVKKSLTKEIARLNVDNIEFTQFSLDKKEYMEMFRGIDCYVSLSKGEGFSIQPREAMALGIPVIATNNTAQSIICESNLIRGVTSSILEPALYPSGDYYGYSYNCEIPEVVKALKDVYSNYNLYLQNSAASREWVKRYLFENLKPLYMTLIKPKKIILGDKNEINSEYMMTDSEDLYRKYNAIKQS